MATILVEVTGTIYSVAGYVCLMLLISGGCLAVLTRQIAVAGSGVAGAAEAAGSGGDPAAGSPKRVETT